MKKILLKAAIGLAVLLVLGVLTVSLFLDATLKRAVETLGPKLAKVDINLDNVSLSLLSGSGAIHGLAVGNPEGFKTPHAIRVASASLAVKPRSLFADKIVIKSIVVDAAEITFEGGFGGNNLSKILSNVESATGPGKTNAAAQPAAQKPGRKLEVDEFVIRNAKLNVSLNNLGGSSFAVMLPDIHLSDLGTGPDGITAGELTKRILVEIERNAVKAASGGAGDFRKSAAGLAKELGMTAGGSATNLTKSFGDLFKKK